MWHMDGTAAAAPLIISISGLSDSQNLTFWLVVLNFLSETSVSPHPLLLFIL